MDTIASLLDASPYGYGRYGLEVYAATFPTNLVHGFGNWWADRTEKIVDFERNHKDQCLRLRYKDLVSGPEREVDRISSFLQISSAPGFDGLTICV